MEILQKFGFDIDFYAEKKLISKEFSIGRVTAEFKERYLLISEEGEYLAEITGKMRYSSAKREDFPAVGDFVMFSPFGDQAIIHEVLPRKTILERRSSSNVGEKQIIGTNIDYACIVQSVDENFNLNRLDRFLTITHSGGISPVVILSKTDLIRKSDLDEKIHLIEKRHSGISIFSLSSAIGEGLDEFRNFLQEGKTYCFLGSSGVGKSTLINHLLGDSRFETATISLSTGKGKHTSTRRELVILPGGPLVIDNPGMREIGVTESESGIDHTFNDITELANRCNLPIAPIRMNRVVKFCWRLRKDAWRKSTHQLQKIEKRRCTA
ncbi:MAG: ribosome small subunit-dependent GTPase A [Bacteroidales bacterium]|nr:ribosome small subunit-dependent GTPase A [Bacteroidales bacterium]